MPKFSSSARTGRFDPRATTGRVVSKSKNAGSIVGGSRRLNLTTEEKVQFRTLQRQIDSDLAAKR
ncbi:MAG TPA: hypothetical protein VGC57_09100 [Cellulomonas sp.]